mmetsp:Transcript_30537/g.47840  ORF Transcript_30537/g.47840 Transcript_30537/m.47840 type:complete len:124 (+) Transcript_30537:347-718(+)
MGATAVKNKLPFRLIAFLGILLLAHAAYSTVQYRKYLRMVGQDFVDSPIDIYIECLIACFLSLIGVLGFTDDYQPIRAAETFHSKTVDDVSFRPEFVSFHHRTRVLGVLVGTGSSGGKNKKRQ